MRDPIVVFGATRDAVESVRTSTDGRSTVNWTFLAAEVPVDAADLDRWSRRADLHAAVVLLDPRTVSNPKFLSFLDRFIERARSIGFGLFVHVRTPLFENESQIHPTIRKLRDELQLAVGRSLSDTLDGAEAFVGRVRSVRLTSRVERLRVHGAAIAGRLSALIETVAALVVMLFWLASVTSPEWRAALAGVLDARLVGVIAGIPWVPALYLPIFFLFDVRVPMRVKAIAMGLMFAVLRGSMDLREAAASPEEWLTFGQVLGLVLEGARRNGARAAWLLDVIRNGTDSTAGILPTAKGSLLPRLSRAALHKLIPEALFLPWFRSSVAAVFLSYTRNSVWSRTVAQEVYLACKRRHIATFYAAESIREGTLWRRALYRRLAQANVLIAIVDDETMKWEWPAREVETALQGYARTGIPRVVVLTTDETAGEASGNIYPIFEQVVARVLKQRRVGGLQAIAIPSDPEARSEVIDTLTWGLETDRFSTPGLLSRHVNDRVGVAAVVAAVIGYIGLFGGLFGFSAAIAGNAVVFVALAYSLGFGARHAINQWLELRESPLGTKLFAIVCPAGLACWLWRSSPPAAGVTLAWAALAGAVGWWVMSFAAAVAAKRAPELISTEDLPEPDASAPAPHGSLAALRERRQAALDSLNEAKELHERSTDPRFSDAERTYERALTLSREVDEKLNIASAYVQLGFVKQQQERYAEADSQYTRALRILESLPSQCLPQLAPPILITEAVCRTRLGLLRLEAGDRPGAEVCFFRARAASIDANDLFGAARAEKLLDRCREQS